MARGYLGKISAVISANTGQYRRGVNEAAQETRNFARSVEQTLRRASSDATKSLQSILTPIQQVQASLRAAGEQGLRFRGFQGAIRDVNELKQRLTALSDQDVRLVLQISGAERITDLQQQLRAINDRDIRIVTRVGGVEGLQAGVDRLNAARDELVNDSGFQVLQGRISGIATRLAELRENSQLQLSLAGTGGDLSEARQLRAEYDLLSQSLTELEQERRRFVSQRIGVNIDFTELEELTSRLRGVNVAVIPALMEGLERSQFTQAEASMLRLVTVAEGLQKPLAESVSEFAKLDLAVQAGFLPSLSEVQNEVQDLARNARNTGDGFEDSFNRIEARADSVITSIRQMSELAKEIATLRTGEELVFQQPQLMGAIGRGREFGNQAATRIERAGPEVRQETVERLRQILALSQDIERQFAVLQNARQGGRDFIAGDIEATIRAQAAEIDRLVDEGRTALNITADTAEATTRVDTLAARIDALRENARFVITGEISANQVVDTLGQINSLLERAKTAGLGASAFQGRVDSLFSDANAASRGDQDALQRFRATFESLRNDIQAGIDLTVRDKKAQDAVNSLTASLDKLRQSADFVITGRAQNLDQVQSEVGRIISSISGLDDAERGALEVRIKAVLDAAGRRDLDSAADELQQLKTASDDAIRVNLEAKTAKAEADQLTASVEKLRQNAEFAITGRAQNFDQVQSELNKIIGGLSKVEQSQRDVLRVDISAALDAIDDGNLTDAIAALERVRQLRDTLGGSAPASTGGLDFGLALDDPQRQIEVIRGSINSLKGQLDTLPAGIRSQFIPAIAAAETQLRNLANNPAATAQEIARAAREVDRLTQSANRARQALNIQSFRRFTDDLNTRQAVGELQALQQILGRIGAQAGGPAAQAYDTYARALRRAIRNGTTGLPQVRRELELLQESAARAAAATGRISFGRALREIRRGGDIARGGFDNLSLAVQQAAFAIDDFFSTTGDFSQRIRAVQNNVTQLAFILGGTRGLFIGLGVAITAQAVVGLINWINNGRTAEDRTKALNDALARQKSLVEALADAFGNLSDALTRGTLSDQAEQAQRFVQELQKAAKARRELNEERIFQNDPNIRREQAEQARIQREIGQAEDPAQQIALQQQLAESRRREQQRRAIALLPPPDAAEVEDRLRARAPNPFRQNVPNLPEGRNLDALLARREALEEPLNRLREIINEGGLSTVLGIPQESFDQLNSLAARLDAAIASALGEIESDLLTSAEGPAAAIRSAQEDVAAAIRDGVPGARELGFLVDEVGQEFQNAVKAVEAAAQIENETERNAALQAAGERLRDAAARRADVEAAGETARSQLIRNPENLLSSVISRIESGISGLGAAGLPIQAELRRLQAERATISRQIESDPANVALARAEDDLTAAIVSLEGEVTALDESFNGFEAREASRLQGDAERGRELLLTPEERAAEELQQGLNDIFARFAEIAEATTGLIDEVALREAQQKFRDEQRSEFEREVERRRNPRGDALRGLDLAETPGQRAARETEQGILDIDAAFREQGRRLVNDAGGLFDIDAAEQQLLDQNEAARQAALRRFAADQRRAAAPAIFGLADSVANAVLQGPSRAALNVSDISTQEGARELNRLLRGEDSARDQNLIELQKQSTELAQVNTKLTALANRVGVAL